MDKVKVIRCSDLENCVLGVITLNGLPQGVTLELPDKSNMRNVSCIPAGTYTGHVIPHESKLTGGCGRLIKLENVPVRDGILIHVGNTVVDTRGCILVGKYFGTLINRPAVLESRETFVKLMNTLTSKEVEVEIVNAIKQTKVEQPVKEPEPEIKPTAVEIMRNGYGIRRRTSGN